MNKIFTLALALGITFGAAAQTYYTPMMSSSGLMGASMSNLFQFNLRLGTNVVFVTNSDGSMTISGAASSSITNSSGMTNGVLVGAFTNLNFISLGGATVVLSNTLGSISLFVSAPLTNGLVGGTNAAVFYQLAGQSNSAWLNVAGPVTNYGTEKVFGLVILSGITNSTGFTNGGFHLQLGAQSNASWITLAGPLTNIGTSYFSDVITALSNVFVANTLSVSNGINSYGDVNLPGSLTLYDTNGSPYVICAVYQGTGSNGTYVWFTNMLPGVVYGVLKAGTTNQFLTRNLTGTSSQITIANATGISGDPTFSTPQNLDTNAMFRVGALYTYGAITGLSYNIGANIALSSNSSVLRVGEGANWNGINFFYAGSDLLDLVSGALVPHSANLIDLGSSSMTWNQGFFGNDISTPGTVKANKGIFTNTVSNVNLTLPGVTGGTNLIEMKGSNANTAFGPNGGLHVGSLTAVGGSNIVAEGTITANGGGTNLFGATVITNSINIIGGSQITVFTNLAPYTTTSNPTNQFTTGILYTNFAQRSLLVGTAVLNGGVSGSANITILYTNNAVGYQLPMQTGAGLATTDQFPFCVPLSTNAVFTFVSTMGTGATGSLTNVVNWQQ